MGAFPQRPTWRSHRSRYFLRYRIVPIVILILFLQQQYLFYSYRDALLAKYSPTYFSSDFEQFLSQFGEFNPESKHLQNALLANRQEWKILGSGREGNIYTYHNSVIKTFKKEQSPLRNCVDIQAGLRWPSEIPASLHFGPRTTDQKDNAIATNTSTAPLEFLPVQAYFEATSHSASLPEWHLVTPLVPGGNLNELSKRIRNRQNPPSFRDLDAQYRPTFHRLLKTLDSMHRDGYCHDDIKPTNLFNRDDTTWIIGDLGNVRHVTHPYHTTRIWRENRQLTDCRANDAVRALKTYFQFLCEAASDPEIFDSEFFGREEPLSVLYWTTMIDSASMSARRLRSLSFSEAPSQTRRLDVQPDRLSFLPVRMFRRKAVDNAIGTGLNDSPARFWSMSWLFGPPEIRC
ncbi:hypothetical protein P280DRAFT_470894 [Massarina eburnea CBS 473.64]|uniref:Protein kinase domain-containing protein n=1 Tax=Massarina eburnea CBS 473.64 TaxID=1395130 RepID=A0A6A6RUL8_9PLEO|nr:hypothetical protein P280DRAFT_470894 [Massarina eburnea CBS 473.64]